jgi:hypothetical protein
MNIRELYPDITLMDGYDDCIIGICERCGQEPIIAYDKDKILVKLMKGGMSLEEAIVFFEYNQIGSWVGTTTPCFIERINNEI